MKLVITGGHHSSALPLIHKIKNEGLDISVFWLGNRHSLFGDTNDNLEYREINALGIPFTQLNTGKFYKIYNPISYLKIITGFVQSFFYLRKVKPDLILSFGGYLAVPVVISGWLMKIPTITHEQTVVIGYANKLISKFARKILISWKESEKFFDKNKVVFTGLPLRESIYVSISNNFSTENSFPYVYITAGKTGSQKINNIVKDALPKLLMQTNVIHQCGDYSKSNSFSELEQFYAKVKNALTGQYFLRKFMLEIEIGEAYQKAALVVGRSGAHTVGEVIALSKPALFIPISWVSHNEQLLNARLAKDCGLAEILEEADLTAEALVEKVKYMLYNLKSYQNHSFTDLKNSSKIATDLILNEVLKYAPLKG